jgi:hypothetical protein
MKDGKSLSPTPKTNPRNQSNRKGKRERESRKMFWKKKRMNKRKILDFLF